MKARALVTLLALTASTAAFAQEEEALVEKVAVKNRLFDTDGRFELGLNVGFTLLTQLTEHYTFNLAISYDIVRTFALELLGGYSYSRHTSLARDVADQFNGSSQKTADDLSGLWEMMLNAVVGLRWQPFYGKIGFFAELPIHFQAYIWAGGGVGYFKMQSVTICNHKTGGECDEFYTDAKLGPLVSTAGGFRFFLPTVGNHHTVRFELRGFHYLDSYLAGVNRQVALTGSGNTGGAMVTQAG